jgi:hypothetical protein
MLQDVFAETLQVLATMIISSKVTRDLSVAAALELQVACGTFACGCID